MFSKLRARGNCSIRNPKTLTSIKLRTRGRQRSFENVSSLTFAVEKLKGLLHTWIRSCRFTISINYRRRRNKMNTLNTLVLTYKK